MESLETGTLPGTGSFPCLQCGYVLSLAALHELAPWPACGSHEFARASLFSQAPSRRRPDDDSGAWIAAVRTDLAEAGTYLAWHDAGETSVVPLTGEWTRIGRSLAADIRFDDPTVSRRHALIVRGPDGVRVLDDRSLNGVFVNGRRVEWSALEDGDEVLVGCHSLRYVEVVAEGEPPASAAGRRRQLTA